MDKQESNNLLFKKYKLMDKISRGSFGDVHIGMNVHTKEKVALKLEERKNSINLLEQEAFILYNLKGPGIPEIKAFGKNKKYNILAQTLLGDSLNDIFNSNKKKFTVKDICNIGIQMLERIEYIHSKDYIHRDIKPQNFLIGKDHNGEHIIYLIDFGFAKKYRSSRGNHVKYSIKNQIIGTPNFSSLNAMKGVEQSRRDDLESFCYIIIYFFKGFLPWKGFQVGSIVERFNAILDMKKYIKISSLCEGLPTEISELYGYVKKLGFTEEPNYNYMKQLFLSILKKNGLKKDNKFSWIKETKEINNNMNNPIINNSNVNNKKSNISKLFKRIKDSLQKKEKPKDEINISKDIFNEKEENLEDYTINNLNTDNTDHECNESKMSNSNNSTKSEDQDITQKFIINLDETENDKEISNLDITDKKNLTVKNHPINFDTKNKESRSRIIINHFVYQKEKQSENVKEANIHNNNNSHINEDKYKNNNMKDLCLMNYYCKVYDKKISRKVVM